MSVTALLSRAIDQCRIATRQYGFQLVFPFSAEETGPIRSVLRLDSLPLHCCLAQLDLCRAIEDISARVVRQVKQSLIKPAVLLPEVLPAYHRTECIFSTFQVALKTFQIASAFPMGFLAYNGVSPLFLC